MSGNLANNNRSSSSGEHCPARSTKKVITSLRNNMHTLEVPVEEFSTTEVSPRVPPQPFRVTLAKILDLKVARARIDLIVPTDGWCHHN